MKVRHVASTEYSGQTAIEEDKFNKLLQHKGKVALLVLFQDCICWFPPSQLFDAFVGITVLCNCADEMHPAYEKKWVKRNKAVGLFDTNKAVKYYYDEYGGKPEFV